MGSTRLAGGAGALLRPATFKKGDEVMKETHCIFVLVVAACGTTPETKSATDPAVQPAFSQVVLEIENHEAARVRTYRMEATPLRLTTVTAGTIT